MTTIEPTQTQYFEPREIDQDMLVHLNLLEAEVLGDRLEASRSVPWYRPNLRNALYNAQDANGWLVPGKLSGKHQRGLVVHVKDERTLIQLVADGLVPGVSHDEITNKLIAFGRSKDEAALVTALAYTFDPKTHYQSEGKEAGPHFNRAQDAFTPVVDGPYLKEFLLAAIYRQAPEGVNPDSLDSISQRPLYSGVHSEDSSFVQFVINSLSSPLAMQAKDPNHVDVDHIFKFLKENPDFQDFGYVADVVALKGYEDVLQLTQYIGDVADPKTLPHAETYMRQLSDALKRRFDELLAEPHQRLGAMRCKLIFAWNARLKVYGEVHGGYLEPYDTSGLHAYALASGITATEELAIFGPGELSLDRWQRYIDETVPSSLTSFLYKGTLIEYLQTAPEDVVALFLDDTQREDGSRSNKEWTKSYVNEQVDRSRYRDSPYIRCAAPDDIIAQIYFKEGEDSLLARLPTLVLVTGDAANYVAAQALDSWQESRQAIAHSNGAGLSKVPDKKVKPFFDGIDTGRIESNDFTVYVRTAMANEELSHFVNPIPPQTPTLGRDVTK